MIQEMDQLSTFHVVIEQQKRSMIFKIPDHPKFDLMGGSKSLEPTKYKTKTIEGVLTARQLVERFILVVSNFLDNFSEEYELLLKGVVEFSIDLMLGATLISKTSYWMEKTRSSRSEEAD